MHQRRNVQTDAYTGAGRRLTRREALRLAGGTTLALLLASACDGNTGHNSSGAAHTGDNASTAAHTGDNASGAARSMPDGSTGALQRSLAPLPTPFSVPLPIPAVL